MSNRSKQKLFTKAVIVLIAIVAVAYITEPYSYGAKGESSGESIREINIGGSVIRATIADTFEAREKGLGDRDSLSEDEGMLFIFPREDRYGIWMKDMRFSIDILWLSADGTIVDMRENVSPSTYPTSFLPKLSAQFVLELPAGFATAHNIRIGDVARF